MDSLAREATHDGIPLSIVPFFSDLLPVLREHVRKIWVQRYEKTSQDKGIWYRTLRPEPFRFPWFESCNFNRKTIVLAFRIRSGHIPLNHFAFIINKTASPMCIVCGKREDVYHMLMECRRNESLRKLTFVDDTMNVGICNCMLVYPSSNSAFSLYKLVNLGLDKRIEEL